MLSPLRNEDMPKRIVFMICGAALFCSLHSFMIFYSLFRIVYHLGHWNRCLVYSARCPHPLGQLGLGHTPLFSINVPVGNFLC